MSVQILFHLIKESLINILKAKRDKKRHEVLKLQWEKAELEKQLARLKAQAAEKEQSAEGVKN